MNVLAPIFCPDFTLGVEAATGAAIGAGPESMINGTAGAAGGGSWNDSTERTGGVPSAAGSAFAGSAFAGDEFAGDEFAGGVVAVPDGPGATLSNNCIDPASRTVPPNDEFPTCIEFGNCCEPGGATPSWSCDASRR